MRDLMKHGYVYIAQPPLYQISRKKRVEYIADDNELNRILIELGSEDVSLKLPNKKKLNNKQVAEILELLMSLDKYARSIQRHGGLFAEYIEQRKKTGELPTHLVKIRDGNEESVHYFHSDSDLAKFGKKNPDLNLFGDIEPEETPKTAAKKSNTRRALHVELHESKPVQELLGKLSRKGLPVEHYEAQDKPLFELIEGDDERVHPLFSLSDILSTVIEIGRRGLQIKRFKGLGEMNPKELFETTMNPETRKLLRVELTDGVEAEEMFTKLMGDEVKPRREFIEDNALNVRNLDI
jgi:DNA gyrase subunit B